MAVNTIEEARKIVLEMAPGMRVAAENEYDKCFVISVVPKDYTSANGIFVGGGMRVDKQTGDVSLFNPLRERVIK